MANEGDTRDYPGFNEEIRVGAGGYVLDPAVFPRAPALFNSDGTPASFDTRSDNKGPKPEAAVIGKVFGRTYAFIGLARAGGIMVYDISGPLIRSSSIMSIPAPSISRPKGSCLLKRMKVPTARPCSWSRMKSATRRAFSRSIRIKQNVNGAVDG